MRYDEAHKVTQRKHLLRQGAVELKKHGFAATGVDKIMRSAGLSGGALYAYYPSKDALLAAIVEAEMARTLAKLIPDKTLQPREALMQILDNYLTLAHVQQPSKGCILPSLAAELTRAPSDVQGIINQAQQQLLSAFADLLGDQQAAQFLMSQLVGAVLMARMTTSAPQQQSVLDASRKFLLTLLP